MKMTHSDLNRRLLWSHCLSNRIDGSDAPVKVADACCGIQSQNFQESFSSFWARIDGFHNNDVMSELKRGGGLVRTRAVRGTMHTIPSKDYYTYVLGGAGERFLSWFDYIAKQRNYPGRVERSRLIYKPVLEEIKGRAVTKEEMQPIVSAKARTLGLKEGVWTGIGEMEFLGLLVYAGKKGSRSSYMRADDWIPGLKAPPDRQTCNVELLRGYIARHGPVSREDIVYWAFFSRQQLDNALADLSSEIVEFKMGGSKSPYIDLDRNIDRRFPPPPRAIVLPKYDSLMMTLRDKSRFMDMRYYKRVFHDLGMVRPTVLVDGFVAAIWRRVAKKKRTSIEVHTFKKLDSGAKETVERKFSEYGEYTGLDVSVRWVRGKWIHQPSR
ncbi:winged helix DNA-binding domain-containing protein [Candidatus Bathyarchaeota archaeon]|nr:MAG: winged helix DNA-binding domain-containing protein [Candidatus Bathyarchaeota archaeon]